MQSETKEMLTVREAALRLGVGEASIYTALRKGQLPSAKVGHARRIPAIAVDLMVSSRGSTNFA